MFMQNGGDTTEVLLGLSRKRLREFSFDSLNNNNSNNILSTLLQ